MYTKYINIANNIKTKKLHYARTIQPVTADIGNQPFNFILCVNKSDWPTYILMVLLL